MIIASDNLKERGINKNVHILHGENVNIGSTERLVSSVLFGFAVIFNVIGSSYLEFYPTSLLIGIAFAVGITMVVGSAYYMLKEPDLFVKVKSPNSIQVEHPLARRSAIAGSC